MEEQPNKDGNLKKDKKEKKSKKHEVKLEDIFTEKSEELSEEYINKRANKIIETLLSEKTYVINIF